MKRGFNLDIINVDDITYEYIRRDDDGNVDSIEMALNKIKFNVRKGEFLCILGANGSGKSTLAKHINAILYPSEGTVWVDGMDTKIDKNLLNIRQTAGMVFQNPDNQIIGTIVEEDVGFGPENIGIPTDEIWTRVEESLNTVGMLDYRKHSPNKLSGGQKQRVAIAGIMAMKPKCIVLDEPTAMLDPNGRKDVLRTLKELNKREGVTIILITHHMDEAIDAEHIIVMEKGNIVMNGKPKDIFSRPEEIKKYRLDLPQVTELAYELQQEGIDMPNGILTIDDFIEELSKVV